MLLAIVVLAFMAGFFQSSLEAEQKKSKFLEKKITQLENQIEEMEF
jgi:hypothetical protein